MSGTWGTGCIPDPDDMVARENQAQPLAGFVNPGAERPAAVSWAHRLDQILDQGDTNSCVGCAIATAIYLRGQNTVPIPRPSEKAIYDLARGRDQGANRDEYDDVGCRPHNAIEAIHLHGLVHREAWPLWTEDPSLTVLKPRPETRWVNVPPDFALFRQAIDARLTGHFRGDFGPIAATLERALYLGQIPVYAQYVRHDYGAVRGDDVYDVPSDEREADLPSHMQAIVGYDEVSFHIASSWGRGHGNEGIVRVAKRVLTSSWSFGRMVITHTPKVVR